MWKGTAKGIFAYLEDYLETRKVARWCRSHYKNKRVNSLDTKSIVFKLFKIV